MCESVRMLQCGCVCECEHATSPVCRSRHRAALACAFGNSSVTICRSLHILGGEAVRLSHRGYRLGSKKDSIESRGSCMNDTGLGVWSYLPGRGGGHSLHGLKGCLPPLTCLLLPPCNLMDSGLCTPPPATNDPCVQGIWVYNGFP